MCSEITQHSYILHFIGGRKYQLVCHVYMYVGMVVLNVVMLCNVTAHAMFVYFVSQYIYQTILTLA